MVWIEAYGMPRQYFSDIEEARRMAILYMKGKTDKQFMVDFYKNKTSKNPFGYVLMDHFSKRRDYSWHKRSSQYGMTSVPLYENGKIMR